MHTPLLLRSSRELSGLSQAEAARRAGTAQSALSAYEVGSKTPTDEVVARILMAEGFRPSALVVARRAEIKEVVARHNADRARLFGSAARGDDTAASDIDLLVHFRAGASLFDLVELADALESLLGVSVDVVSEAGLSDRHSDVLLDAIEL